MLCALDSGGRWGVGDMLRGRRHDCYVRQEGSTNINKYTTQVDLNKNDKKTVRNESEKFFPSWAVVSLFSLKREEKKILCKSRSRAIGIVRNNSLASLDGL
jgi:hypothetical protein